MTLVELLVVVALGAIMLAVSAAYTVPWFAREAARSSAHEVETYLQLARIEAVSRNQACRFVLDQSGRNIRVLDTMGTSVTTDDEVLYERDLPNTVAFANPEGGSAVTLFDLGSQVYHAIFAGDGTVQTGAGTVNLFGGERYTRVTVFDAGGMRTTHWNGSGWETGS